MIRLFLFLSLFVFLQCSTPEPAPDPMPEITDGVRYLALGDSYTIGESVAQAERYPVQFSTRLQEERKVDEVRIIAKTGWTTTNLQAAIAAEDLTAEYDLVSLLIGVNNQYQGKSIEEYEVEFTELLEEAILLAKGRSDRVFVLSIPDWAYTPFGQNRPDPAGISAEIDAFNAVNKSISDEYDILYFDITPISRQGIEQPELVATDNLHPSAKMYEAWVDLFYEDVVSLLNQ